MASTNLSMDSCGFGQMRTSRQNLRRVGLFGGAILVATLGLNAIGHTPSAARAQEIDASRYRLPVQDIGDLGDVTLGVPPTVAISQDAALAAANVQYDAKALGATDVQAFLETVTVGGTLATADPIRDRAVWIVRMSGMAQVQGGPMTEDGTPAAGHVLHTAYIVVDAVTGAVLMAVWVE